MNVALTPLRCQVERLFGLMKRSYGYRRVRYRGLARNRAQLLLAQLLLMCMAINLRRADRLLRG
jgi:IS5 family transposase